MKNLVPTAFFLILALPLLLLEAGLGVVPTMYRLWGTWLRTARELREAPPPGGMYGTMARRLRERAAETARRHDLSKTTTTNGGMK